MFVWTVESICKRVLYRKVRALTRLEADAGCLGSGFWGESPAVVAYRFSEIWTSSAWAECGLFRNRRGFPCWLLGTAVRTDVVLNRALSWDLSSQIETSCGRDRRIGCPQSSTWLTCSSNLRYTLITPGLWFSLHLRRVSHSAMRETNHNFALMYSHCCASCLIFLSVSPFDSSGTP